VYAFEPAPETFALLKKNIAANNCTNVEPYECALSDSSGTTFLWLNEENHGDNRLVAEGSLAVAIRRLDDVIPPGTRVDFIKIDTQGAETKVLRGAKRVLDESLGLKMLIEYWPYGLAQGGSSGEELLSVLEKHDFAFAPLGKAIDHCTVENRRFTNLLVQRKTSA
jgi:FkbM family methyltransferase